MLSTVVKTVGEVMTDNAKVDAMTVHANDPIDIDIVAPISAVAISVSDRVIRMTSEDDARIIIK